LKQKAECGGGGEGIGIGVVVRDDQELFRILDGVKQGFETSGLFARDLIRLAGTGQSEGSPDSARDRSLAARM
jgi:hypothetical protein